MSFSLKSVKTFFVSAGNKITSIFKSDSSEKTANTTIIGNTTLKPMAKSSFVFMLEFDKKWYKTTVILNGFNHPFSDAIASPEYQKEFLSADVPFDGKKIVWYKSGMKQVRNTDIITDGDTFEGEIITDKNSFKLSALPGVINEAYPKEVFETGNIFEGEPISTHDIKGIAATTYGNVVVCDENGEVIYDTKKCNLCSYVRVKQDETVVLCAKPEPNSQFIGWYHRLYDKNSKPTRETFIQVSDELKFQTKVSMFKDYEMDPNQWCAVFISTSLGKSQDELKFDM